MDTTRGASLRIEEIEQGDETALRAYWSVAAAARRVDVPLVPVEPWQELVADLLDERSTRRHRWVAWRGDRPVGITELSLPLLDNTDAAWLSIVVHPQSRRQGTGRALLQMATELMVAAGRDHAMGDVAQPLDGEVTPGAAFGAAMGAKLALEEICRVLEVSDVDDAALATLEQDATAHAEGYELVQWVGPCTDDVADDLAVLTARMVSDAPMGELDWNVELWDRERVRESEQRAARLRRQWATTAARHRASGRVVAYSDLGWSTVEPSIGHQWTTIVAPEHRGHRLGLLVKAANLRLLQREAPAVERVFTWNAESNAHMIAINETLGFRPRLRFGQWQLRLPS